MKRWFIKLLYKIKNPCFLGNSDEDIIETQWLRGLLYGNK